MKTLLVTGGIGSGKTLVCDYLQNNYVPVYNSDERTKQLYDRHPELVARLEEALGEPLRGEDGRLDRKRLASIIFSDAEKRKTVEDIVHPLVRKDFDRWCAGQEYELVAMEAAAGLESEAFRDAFDAVVLVTSPLEERMRRVAARDGLSEEEIKNRVDAQDFGSVQPDIVLENDADIPTLHARVEEIIAKFV
ncbi:MAG: dephospho-CoA kinase [Bacteroidales bacterium]|nr:dephospho-CoA kinase [Bacteroidales bacterium]